MLTTHDMDDIEAVCERLIMINKGQMMFDGELKAFRNKFGHKQIIRLEFSDGIPIWQNIEGLRLSKTDSNAIEIEVLDNSDIRASVSRLLSLYNPQNIFIQEPNIEDIVELAYKEKA